MRVPEPKASVSKTYVYDDVTYVYDDVTYVYDDADLQWLSAFPNEAEILFPPLTYMQPNGKVQVVEIDGYHFTIVEVHTTTA